MNAGPILIVVWLPMALLLFIAILPIYKFIG